MDTQRVSASSTTAAVRVSSVSYQHAYIRFDPTSALEGRHLRVLCVCHGCRRQCADEDRIQPPDGLLGDGTATRCRGSG